MNEAETIERPRAENSPIASGEIAAAIDRAIVTKAADAPPTIRETILAQYAAIEPTITALAARYDNVAYDVSNAKGLAEAKAARHDLRENGRYMLNRALEAKTSEVNDGKKLLATETERLVALIEPVETDIDKQIKAEEMRRAAEKAERERLAAEVARLAADRRERFEGEIEKIRDCAVRAKGLPAARIERGIEIVADMAFGEDWAEFAESAAAAQSETLAAMRVLLAAAKETELAAAQAEEQRVELARVAAEQAAEAERLKAQADQLAAQQAEIARQFAELEEAKNAARQAVERTAREAEEAKAKAQADSDAARAAEEKRRADEWEAFEAGEKAAALAASLATTTAPVDTSFDAVDAGPETAANIVDTSFDAVDLPAETVVQAAAPGPITFAEPAPAAADLAPITIGQINARLGFTVTAAFLTGALGMTELENKGRAVMFAGADWPVLKAALIAHIEGTL